MPVQEKIGSGSSVENLGKTLHCLVESVLIQLSVTGRDQRDNSGLYPVPIGIAAYANTPNPADSLEIEAEASQPRFPKNEQPRVYFIFLRHFSAGANDSKYFPEASEMQKA